MNKYYAIALKFIDLGMYDEAIDHLKLAIKEAKSADNGDMSVMISCVLGELYANLGKISESKAVFTEVKEYCDKTNSLPAQKEIAEKFLNSFDAASRPQNPRRESSPNLKPQQNKAFITRQMRKRK